MFKRKSNDFLFYCYKQLKKIKSQESIKYIKFYPYIDNQHSLFFLETKWKSYKIATPKI